MAMLALFPCTVAAQGNAPTWIDANVRNLQYPQETYYSGFAEIKITQKETKEEVLNRAKQAATGELSQKIRMVIISKKTSKDESTRYISQDIMEEQIQSQFSAIIETKSLVEITDSKLETWYDNSTHTVYAFAAVRRSDLAAFYQNQIGLELNKVETALAMAKQLAAVGKKKSAFRKCDETIKIFKEVTYFQNLLVAVNANATHEALQLEQSSKLQKELAEALSNLEQSTYVYVDCRYEYKGNDDDAFSRNPEIICNIIKQAHSKNDCSIVDDEREADYTLSLTACTTQRSDGSGEYGIISYYANVKGTLYNHLTQKKSVDFTIFNDPNAYSVGKSAQDAATKAFKLPALKEKILEEILPKIKN
jgi:hypothetical protein